MAENGKPTTSDSIYLNTIRILQERIHILEQMMVKNHLVGKAEILQATGWTDYQLKKLVSKGLPVRPDDGTLYADRRNIDEWYRMWTRVSNKNAEVE